jgi:acyl carrier protein
MEQKIAKIFQDIFGMPPDQFNDSCSMENMKEWDSVTHMTLVLALEESFGVEISPEEIAESTSVARIKQVLSAHGVK